MADDKMKDQGSQKKQGNFGQQTPGRANQDDDEFTSNRDASQRSEPGHMTDDFGSGEQGLGEGGQNQGGKNRQNY